MTERGRFVVGSEAGIPVLEVAGEVDIANIAVFEAALTEVADLDAGAIVISLVRTEYIDSRTVYALGKFINRMNVNRQNLFFALPAESKLRRLLEFTGLLQIMAVREDRTTALAAARASLSGT